MKNKIADAEWKAGLQYFVIKGHKKPLTVYRKSSTGLELMMSSGWAPSISNKLTGLKEIPERAARVLWKKLFKPTGK